MSILTHPLSWSPEDGENESSDYVLVQGAYIVQFINPLSDTNPGNTGSVSIDGEEDSDDTGIPQGFTLFGAQEITGLQREAPQFDVIKDNGSNYEYQLPRPVRKPITLNMTFVTTARAVGPRGSSTWKLTTNLRAMELWHKYSVGHTYVKSGAATSLFDIASNLDKINFGYGPRSDYESLAYCKIIKLMELENPSQRLNGYGGFNPDNCLRWEIKGAKIIAIDYGKLSVASAQQADSNLLMSISVQGMLDW